MANTINGLFPNSIFGIKSVNVNTSIIDIKLNNKIMLSEHLSEMAQSSLPLRSTQLIC